ncbi:MAG: hypothetical protein R2774_09540 [Saprospiraceae bacterium]
MKKSISVYLISAILFVACNKNETQIPTCENCNFTCLEINEPGILTNNCINNWECNFKVVPKSKVDLSKHDGLALGDKIVFQMIKSTQGIKEVADDEISEILVFEIDENQNSFSVSDEELENMAVSFRRICYCPEVEFKRIISGCMQGEKQSDGTWFIQGNLNLHYSSGPKEIKFDAKFAN